MSILVSGGAGYIGSHTCIELMKAGYEILVADNLYNSCEEALRRVERIAGQSVPFVNIDLCDAAAVDELFRTHHGIEAVSYTHLLSCADVFSFMFPRLPVRIQAARALSPCSPLRKARRRTGR